MADSVSAAKRGGGLALAMLVFSAGLLSCGSPGRDSEQLSASKRWSLGSNPTPVPEAPLEGLTDVLAIGQRFFVYGSAADVKSGILPMALFDPDTGIWEPVPQPPLDGTLLEPHTTVIGEDELILVATQCAALQYTEDIYPTCRPGTLGAAILSMATGRWERLNLPSHGGPQDGAKYTRSSIFPGGARPVLMLSDSWFTFDATDRSFMAVERPPVPTTTACATPTGPVLVYAPTQEEAGFDHTDTQALNAPPPASVIATVSLDSSGRWRVAPDLDAKTQLAQVQLVVCDGDGATVLGKNAGIHYAYARRFDTKTVTWRGISVPDVQIGYPESWATDDGVVLNDPFVHTFRMDPKSGEVSETTTQLGVVGSAAFTGNGVFLAFGYPTTGSEESLGAPQLVAGRIAG